MQKLIFHGFYVSLVQVDLYLYRLSLFYIGGSKMRGLSKFSDKNVNIYDENGVLLITGKLKHYHPGFIVNGSGICYVSNRALCRKKIPRIEGYQLVTRGNYDISIKPKREGFKYKF